MAHRALLAQSNWASISCSPRVKETALNLHPCMPPATEATCPGLRFQTQRVGTGPETGGGQGLTSADDPLSKCSGRVSRTHGSSHRQHRHQPSMSIACRGRRDKSFFGPTGIGHSRRCHSRVVLEGPESWRFRSLGHRHRGRIYAQTGTVADQRQTCCSVHFLHNSGLWERLEALKPGRRKSEVKSMPANSTALCWRQPKTPPGPWTITIPTAPRSMFMSLTGARDEWV